jgi:hypothetical protein
MARGLAGLNVVALAAGLYTFAYGVEALYPENAVTYIIYASKDVAEFTYHRVPSIFLSAAAYGGAMLFSLPLLLDRTFGAGVGIADRVLAAAGAAAAIGGVLLCASRSPVVMTVLAALIAWAVTRFDLRIGLVAAGLVVAGGVVALTSDRLQRVASLEDPEVVSDRVRGSMDDSFLDLLSDYPLGAGMGSSAGTSIPYFLGDRAPKAVGLENEYCRIMVDQGWIGLVAWCVFLGWLLGRPPPVLLHSSWGLGVVLMYALLLTNWGTAFLGTGTLSSVPSSVMMLAQMGVLIRIRERVAVRPGEEDSSTYGK